MTNLKSYGRVFYGVGIIGIGGMHFVYKGIRPMIMPIPHQVTANFSVLIYLMALYIIASGVLITMGRYVKPTALLLGLFFFICLLAGHLPPHLPPNAKSDGWMEAIEFFALCGGAFVVALAYPGGKPSPFFDKLSKVAPAGIWVYALMLCVFGIGHLLLAQSVSKMVPPYIPWPVFWTYLAGIALLGSGLAFLIKFKVRQIGLLFALVLFLWLIMLHLYYAIMFPQFQEGQNITGSFQTLSFCGTAILIAFTGERRVDS